MSGETSNGNDAVSLQWYKILTKGELPEGRVKTAVAGHKTLCIAHHEGRISALDNHCPHQGGPLGEGSIENGYLRCPWHGWDYDPATGKPPGGYDDGIDVFPIAERDDGFYVGLAPEKKHETTVTDLMAETMTNWGIDSVFGLVGHSCLGLADAVRRQEEAGKLNFFTVRHEGAGAFAASAYAKLTGRPAACLTIAGPGATNLLTGLWDAKVDRAPILALTGQVDTQVVGPGAFQEVDLQSAFGGVAVWSQPVLHSSKHAELMTLAIKNAVLQRDVAHLIFPDEVQTVVAGEGAQASGPEGRITPREIHPPKESLGAALALIQKAKRPIIIVGHGARFHRDEIIEFAEEFRMPVLTTFKGKGIIPDAHPLACGVLGRSGTPIASWFMNECDAILALGASFSNHTGITPKKPTIQVDYDPMMLGKFHSVDVPVWGEIGVTLAAIREVVAPSDLAAVDQRAEVAERWRIWREEKAARLKEDRGQGVSSIAIFEALNRHVPENAVIAVDVGNNTYSFGRYFECKNQSVLMSGYLGSIGFGYPAAMGAWAAENSPPQGRGGTKRPIVAITGDGGFGQYMGELLTAVKYKMKITHVLLNNSSIGKIKKEQLAGKFDVWQTDLHNPNFAQYADNCGALGIRVTEAAQLESALAKAFAHDGPAMVEVLSDPELI
ncbi:MAG: thiamine pyrophosphate-binding protein [Leptospirales bacterium]|jgi:pyruvate oxidase